MRINKAIPFTAAVALFCAVAVLGQAPAAPPPQSPPSAPQVRPAPAPPVTDSQPVGKERFQGTIVNQGGMGSRAFLAGFFTVEIDLYTSDQETLALALALQNGKQKGLLDKIWKMKQIGFLKVGGSMGFPLFVARSKETPGGRLIRCITNRPIAPSELNMGARSLEYAFGYIEMFVPTEGKGNGTIIRAASLAFTSTNTVTVESYGILPYQLIDVGLEVKKK